jgi:flagellin
VTGVTATAYNRVEGKVVGLGELSIDEIYVGTIDGASTNAVSVGASFSSLAALAAAINEKAPGVTAEVSSEGRIILSNTTGADIVLDGAGLAAAGFEPDPNTGTNTLTSGTADTYNKYAGFIKFENNDGSSNPISFEIDADAGTAADLKVFGLNVKTAEGVVSGGTVEDGASITANQAITINGVSIGAIDTDTAAAYMEAINAVTAETGVTATALTEFFIKANDDAGSAGEYAFDLNTGSTAGDGTEFSINGIDVAVAATGNSEALVTAINTAVNSVGIYAEGKADGTIRIYSQNGGDLEFSGSSFNAGTALENATAIKGKLSLTSANDELISISSLATTDADRATAVAKSGLVYTNDYDADGAGLNVATASAASSALATLDEAITLLSNNRAEMGAYLKRFEAETSNLQVSIEKTASALSAIMDADYAVESANLAKAQVLQQAGTAMLAQANASTQNVLSLLK